MTISNRRRGIANSQEFFLEDWLFTKGSYDGTVEGRYLTIEKFRGDVRVLAEKVKLYKSVCVREANGRWFIVTDYGRQDVVELKGLTASQVQRMAAKFGMTCTTPSTHGAPKLDVLN